MSKGSFISFLWSIGASKGDPNWEWAYRLAIKLYEALLINQRPWKKGMRVFPSYRLDFWHVIAFTCNDFYKLCIDVTLISSLLYEFSSYMPSTHIIDIFNYLEIRLTREIFEVFICLSTLIFDSYWQVTLQMKITKQCRYLSFQYWFSILGNLVRWK